MRRPCWPPTRARRSLAEEAQAGRLKVSLAEVWTGGETLTAPMRAQIEAAFGSPVANSYGASEFLAIAAPCVHGVLHLNADWVILEPVDERGRPVPAGVCGASVWLTNLANHVQPLIRYELGDRVTLLAEPCACGSPLPAIEVQGRSDDMLCLHGARGSRVRLLPLALTTVLEDDGGVLDFQLVQTGPSALRLDLGAHDTVVAKPFGRDLLLLRGGGRRRATGICLWCAHAYRAWRASSRITAGQMFSWAISGFRSKAHLDLLVQVL